MFLVSIWNKDKYIWYIFYIDHACVVIGILSIWLWTQGLFPFFPFIFVWTYSDCRLIFFRVCILSFCFFCVFLRLIISPCLECFECTIWFNSVSYFFLLFYINEFTSSSDMWDFDIATRWETLFTVNLHIGLKSYVIYFGDWISRSFWFSFVMLNLKLNSCLLLREFILRFQINVYCIDYGFVISRR